MLYGVEYRRLGYFVENYAVRILLVKPEHLAEVPRYGLSLAVFIGGEPYFFRVLGVAFQFGYELFLLFGYLVVGRERVGVYAEFLLLEVTYVAVTGHHLVVFAQKLLDRLCLGRTLDDYQILLHCVVYVFV